MAGTRLNYTSWLLRVVAWDGILPLVLLGFPHLVRWLIPNGEKLIEIMGVFFPIAAFFLRIIAGVVHIRGNHCGPRMCELQQVALFFGVVVLVFFDAFMILSLNVPAGAIQLAEFVATGVVVFSIYLPCLTFAMYPGREAIPSSTIGNWEVECQPLN